MLTLPLLCTNHRSLGECDKTAACTVIDSSPKQTLNRKRTTRKQKETLLNFAPSFGKKTLPKSIQADYSDKILQRKFYIISSCYILLLSKIKPPSKFPRKRFNNTVLTKQLNRINPRFLEHKRRISDTGRNFSGFQINR